jgi:uncharacterized alkaline shock family protein YloU
MFKIAQNDLGEIIVGREVVETVAGLAALDCYGLVGMVPKNFQEGLVNVLGRDSVRKGVHVTALENGLAVDLFCIVGYGVRISEVATNVMHQVAYALREEAGIPVTEVNINVRGIKVSTD